MKVILKIKRDFMFIVLLLAATLSARANTTVISCANHWSQLVVTGFSNDGEKSQRFGMQLYSFLSESPETEKKVTENKTLLKGKDIFCTSQEVAPNISKATCEYWVGPKGVVARKPPEGLFCTLKWDTEGVMSLSEEEEKLSPWRFTLSGASAKALYTQLQQTGATPAPFGFGTLMKGEKVDCTELRGKYNCNFIMKQSGEFVR